MAKNMKTRKGKDGFNYPYTSPDLVIDPSGKSVTTKFNELEDKIKKVGSTSIDDANTTTDTTWSSSKIDSQLKDIANKTIVEDNKLYLVKADGTKIDNGTELPINRGSSIITNKFYKTESIGQLYDQPGENNYIAWCPGDLRYDKNLDKYIMLAYCCDKHVNTTIQEVYQIVINPYTYETSKPVKIKILDIDGKTDITPVKFGCCSYIILNDGTYLMINQIDNVCYKFMSTDNGLTWVKQNTVTGYSGAPWGMYELSNGRIIISDDMANVGLWYSDDKGDTWANVKPSGTPGNYNAEGCILELGNNKLMCIARKNMTGSGGYAPNNNNYSGASEHAIISYSNDNGTTWTAWQESNSIDNMNASCCTGIAHDNIVEIFACSRWYISQNYENTDHANTGKCGAITHYTATIENALNDNFTNKGIVVYSKAVGNDSSQDFHSPCLSKDKNDNILLVYFDRIGNGVEEKTNHYFIRGTLDTFDYSIKDGLNSNIFTYSSNYINKLLSVQKTQLITLINQAVNGGGTVVDPDNPDVPVFYVKDNLVCNFNFLDESKMNKTNMTVTDTVNKIVGTFTTSSDGNTLVTTFPTVNKNYMENSFFKLEKNILNTYITDINYEYSIELGIYFESKSDLNSTLSYMTYLVDGNGADSVRIYSNLIGIMYDTNSTQKSYKGISCGNLFSADNPGFYHIVITYSNTGIVNAYSNGSLIKTYNVENFKNWYNGNIQNASWFIQPKRFMRIYKKVLTQDEVLNNYKYEKSLII